MQRVLVNMQGYIMSDAIKMALLNDGDFTVSVVEKPDDLAGKCYTLAADAAIMEVTAYAPWRLEERLKIIKKIKKRCPNCKIVFLVDEKADKSLAERVQQAKVDGLIDQFIYSSISTAYLAALVKTI